MTSEEKERLIQMIMNHEGGTLGEELKAAKTLEEKRKIAEEALGFLIGIQKNFDKKEN